MDGKTRLLGPSRSIVLDVLRQAARVPSFPVERKVAIDQLEQARKLAHSRISWTAIFCRAYGLASRQFPHLRQMVLTWPWARVYQSPRCVIAIAVNRELPGGERLFFGRIASPDSRSLIEIQSDLDRFQNLHPSQVFQSQWRGSYFPTFIRRLVWWWRMDVDHKNRARRVGTGSISALAGLGVTNRLHPCMMTSSLSFGPIENDGSCLVTLQCDHRVIDGVIAARALNGICDFLTGQVLDELIELRSAEDARSSSHAA